VLFRFYLTTPGSIAGGRPLKKQLRLVPRSLSRPPLTRFFFPLRLSLIGFIITYVLSLFFFREGEGGGLLSGRSFSKRIAEIIKSLGVSFFFYLTFFFYLFFFFSPFLLLTLFPVVFF
jgi:hypothetical protein